jgi:hypothetical protein
VAQCVFNPLGEEQHVGRVMPDSPVRRNTRADPWVLRGLAVEQTLGHERRVSPNAAI